MARKWTKFPHADKAYVHDAASLKKQWARLHKGDAEPFPKDAAFTFDPPVPAMNYQAPERVRGALLGCFGPAGKTTAASTHLLVVNLDYKTNTVLGLRGPVPVEIFDAATGRWLAATGPRAELNLPRGGGMLVRVSR